MKDERYKQIMKDLGYPDSQSLLIALQQVANEVAQECMADIGNKWVSVDTDLPQDDFEVLCQSDDDVTLAVYRHNVDGSYYFDGMVNVTHWMDKPEPPTQ